MFVCVCVSAYVYVNAVTYNRISRWLTLEAVFLVSYRPILGVADDLQSTDLEEWEEIGDEVQQVHDDLIELVHSLNKVPKSV